MSTSGPRQTSDHTYDEVSREPNVKGSDVLDLLQMLGGKRYLERLNVGVQVFNLAAANQREDIRSLLHEVRDSHYNNGQSKLIM